MPTAMLPTMTFGMCLLCACGPSVVDDEIRDDGPAEEDVADQDCEDGPCASDLACGEEQRNCVGPFGIGKCVDGQCGPKPVDCVGEFSSESNCNESCSSRDLICVENGCDGATAFGLPGPEEVAIGQCGVGSSSARDIVTDIHGPCDRELNFSGEGSFSVYQCCCDNPEH